MWALTYCGPCVCVCCLISEVATVAELTAMLFVVRLCVGPNNHDQKLDGVHMGASW